MNGMIFKMRRITSETKGPRYKQGGFTLLEALVAMFILAVALLGLAGMQIFASAYNIDASELTQATNLAAEMIDRVQYNRANVLVYQGIDTTLGGPCPNAPFGPPPPFPVARGDCLQWQLRLNASGLDQVRGLVTVTSPLGPAVLNRTGVLVQVYWTTKRVGSSSTTRKRSRGALVALNTVITPP